jgi:hypothetical protein
LGNKKNKMSKKGTKSSGSSSSKPVSSSYSKDAASSSKTKTCTWCTKHYPSNANGHGWYECSKLKKFNKSVPKDKGKGTEQHVAVYNLDTDSEVEGLIHQDAEFKYSELLYMMPGPFDIRPICEVRVGNGAGIPVYGIGTISLFVVFQDGSIKNVMLKDCLYVPSLMKSLFSWSKLKFLNQHYLEDREDMLVRKIVNNEVILWAKECPRTHLFNIPTRTLEAHITYTFWHKALGYPSYDLMKYVNMFSDGDLIPSKPKNFDCDSCLQSKSIT